MDKLTDLTLMDRPWSDVSSTEIGHVGANEISRDDVNVIHIFCIFFQQYVTLPPVRALGKTRKGGKKKKTPMERERNNVYIYVYTSMCEIRRGRGRGRERAEKQPDSLFVASVTDFDHALPIWCPLA